ncbi:MAG: hypothetical protein ACYSU0_03820 [Planctomycetota bacterium]|jgi:hypothetical protein
MEGVWSVMHGRPRLTHFALGVALGIIVGSAVGYYVGVVARPETLLVGVVVVNDEVLPEEPSGPPDKVAILERWLLDQGFRAVPPGHSSMGIRNLGIELDGRPESSPGPGFVAHAFVREEPDGEARYVRIAESLADRRVIVQVFTPPASDSPNRLKRLLGASEKRRAEHRAFYGFIAQLRKVWWGSGDSREPGAEGVGSSGDGPNLTGEEGPRLLDQ